MAMANRKEELATFHTENENAWLRDRRRAISARLQDKTQTTLKAALTIKPGSYRNSVTHEEHVVIGKELAGLSDAERLALFESIFPKLALAMDRAWRDLPRRAAYIEQNVYYSPRVPFRAGSAAHHLAVLRGAWFEDVVSALVGYDPDPEWLAAWITHLHRGEDHVASVLAGAIDLGGRVGDSVLEILKASATNTHPIGEMSFAVIQALLISARPEAWDFVADLFLNGSRQEGLRQAILESIHECHPDAFIRMLHLIMEERLVRFSSVVRAADVWFGLRWDSIGPAPIQKQIERAYLYLTDEAAREKAQKSGTGEEAYMALWCVAFRDLGRAAAESIALMKDKDPERRFAAVTLARMARAREFLPVFVAALADPDDRVVAGAVRGLKHVGYSVPESLKSEAIFDGLARVFDRAAAAKPTKLEPIIWPWTAETLSTRFIGEPLTRFVPKSRVEEMIPRIAQLAPHERKQIVADIGRIGAFEWMWERAKGGKKPRPLSAEAHATLLTILGDAAAETRNVAFRALSLHPITPAERDRIEELLARKAPDLRTKGLERLLTQTDEDALASAVRLLRAPGVEQQLAGAEILTEMAGKKRSPDRVAAEASLASESLPRAGTKKPDARVLALLRKAQAANVAVPTLRDCLGLVPPDRVLIPPDSVPKPRKFEPLMMTREAIELVMSLDALVERHKDLPVQGVRDPELPEQEMLLGSVYGYQIWSKRSGANGDSGHISQRSQNDELEIGEMQHAAIWTEWWNTRRAALGEAAEITLLRSWLLDEFQERAGSKASTVWRAGLRSVLPRASTPTPTGVTRHILAWLMLTNVDRAAVELLIDQAELSLAEERFIASPVVEGGRRASDQLPTPALTLTFERWMHYVGKLAPALPKRDAEAVRRRTFQLHRIADAYWPDHYQRIVGPQLKQAHDEDDDDEFTWTNDSDERCPRPSAAEIVAAIQAGEADEIDFIRLALLQHEGERWEDHFLRRWSIGWYLSGPNRCQAIVDAYRMIRARVAELELARGDAKSDATKVSEAIQMFGGASIAVRAIAALKGRPLRRGYLWGRDRPTSLSRLVVLTLPQPGDTDESFGSLVAAHEVSEARLVELALYAPQWAGHVERHLGWTGLEDACWWILAHAKNTDEHMWNAHEVRTFWRSRVAERTVVDREDFKDGAVDRAWFLRIHKALGEKRWNQIYALAKAAAAGANHKRAQTFADAILGRTKAADLKKAIATKRTQDAARALGLVPLPSGDAGRKELKDRYLVMQEMRRTSRKHGGSMLQASEKRAVEIGLENLARTAGYADPQRLQWAMEIEASGDLATGALTRKSGDITVTLAIDDEGGASVSCEKKGKRLASVPPAAKKAPEIADLLERSRELKKQKSRVRRSLEEAMCRGDVFTGAELRTLSAHPVLRPMLERLVLVGDGKSPRSGYAESNATRLRAVDGRSSALREKETFRIAHPHDLLESGNWSAWQRECFSAERIQPFKQVFRELYVPTPAEKKGKSESTRYAGHQVQPRQAIALLGSRGWVVRPDDGVQRTFHHERVRAFLSFDEAFYTPAEVEGLTVESITFRPLGSADAIKLTAVPPRVFSEVMRDVDLAVSVAHRGGVDPEASESTVEARASLARETCSLLKLANVKIKNAHAIIKGERADYSVHLGSGIIHMLPGGSIEVVAVGAHHRGRLFLPFADEDPKTAEILSKILLFARDGEIKDPFILEQIRSR